MKMFLLGSKGMNAVRNAISMWNRQRQSPTERVRAYTLGCHLKPTLGCDLLWSHLHLSLVVGKSLKQNPLERGGIFYYLGQAFEHAVDIADAGTVRFESKALRLHASQLDEETRKAQRRGRTITYNDLCRIFAYTSRMSEDDDTTDTILLRDRMIRECGKPQCTTHSRDRNPNRTDKPAAVTQPHSFDPGALGHLDARVFEFGKYYPTRFDPSEFHEVQQQLIENAKELLKSYAPSSSRDPAHA
ncbi:hypothetical protein [Aporhodopirellula aestuarii]|uniref:Uncharacterized protein n=1 Tax=Aporhodopirellula aestuarii TaxID=2950107 RepID=A0ABT0U0K0_9BACT|nr:hypothetical protein [Aporhodopirellula aestuarii]MCM2370377.1 hypothetical protein [Aporhodopirellula aestuarii]